MSLNIRDKALLKINVLHDAIEEPFFLLLKGTFNIKSKNIKRIFD